MLQIAVPVCVVQVGLMAMGVVDTIMVGHVSERALAAVALGNVFFFTFSVFGMGLLMALDPVVAQAVGAGETVPVARAIQRGMLIAAAVSVPTALLLVPGDFFLTALRQPAEVIPIAAGYARVSIPGVFPFFAFIVLRQSLQAMGHLSPIVISILLMNVVNVVLNWALVFGHLGFPALGPIGTAWATSISRILLAAVLLAMAWRSLRPHLLPVRPDAFALRPLLRMVRLGAPLGAQHVVEYGAFAAIALLMGWLGPREMAAHQIALNLAALTFMVPLGVSSAAAVRVGYAVGRADPMGVRRSAATALVWGTGFMVLTAILFLSAPEPLARMFTNEEAVWTVAAALIPIAGFFQVFDGLQVVAAGVLRGLGDTRAPMLINVLGLWFIGLPVSLTLAFVLRVGPAGLWWGFVAGLGSVSLILLARVRVRLRRGMPRVVIDDEPGPLDSRASPELPT